MFSECLHFCTEYMQMLPVSLLQKWTNLAGVGGDSVGVAMLENMLVTEKEIFGDDTVLSDECDDGNDGSTINSNIDDNVVTEQKTLSAEELASIEEEFKKVTALPSGNQSMTPHEKKSQVGTYDTEPSIPHSSSYSSPHSSPLLLLPHFTDNLFSIEMYWGRCTEVHWKQA